MTGTREFSIRTSQREQIVDVTDRVRQVVRELGVADGIVHIYCPHTTAGILIQENSDPDLKEDILEALARLVPREGWRHREGNADAHLKSIMCGASATLPLQGGRLMLGTWQDIYFGEFDGPRSRTVIVTVVG
ncbi:MAG: secondary thiamine-phosphate synthase enzyme YjbQ [Pseudomonadota bacterium]